VVGREAVMVDTPNTGFWRLLPTASVTHASVGSL
jgi:hypothetical protein